MRDFLPADIRKREYVIGIIKQVYESYGFEPLETPAVEHIDTLMGKYGEEGNQLIFKILKRGEKLQEEFNKLTGPDSPLIAESISDLQSEISDLALRYDLTVPLARVVANNRNSLPKFFKRYQIQPVWRADRPARGRFREFYQCDVDAIGSKSLIVEAELISAASEILIRLGFEDFWIRLNHRDLLHAILDSAGVAEEHRTAALVAIDKLDKISIEEVAEELRTAGISDSSISSIDYLYRRVTSVWEQGNEINQVTLGIVLREYLAAKTLEALDIMYQLSSIVRFSRSTLTETTTRLVIDPFLARGLSYYTGSIMEVGLSKGDFTGSIGGGGRYDGLIGMFGKEQIPACGFSLGLERILMVMEERGMFPPQITKAAPADVMVTLFQEKPGIWPSEMELEDRQVDRNEATVKFARELRAAGLRVTVYPEPDKLGKQLKYANSIGVPYVCVFGETEQAEGKITLKNMKTGEQELLAKEEVAAKIKRGAR